MASAATASPASVRVDEPLVDEHADDLGAGSRALLHRASPRAAIVARASTSALRRGWPPRARSRPARRRARASRADDHHDLRRQEALAQQAAAGLADRLAEARRPQVLDQHDSRVLALRDLVGQAPQVVAERSRPCGGTPPAASCRRCRRRSCPSRCAIGFAGSGGSREQRVEVDLGELAVLARGCTKPRVDHPEQPAPAQEAISRAMSPRKRSVVSKPMSTIWSGPVRDSSMTHWSVSCQDGTDEPFADPRQPCRRR